MPFVKGHKINVGRRQSDADRQKKSAAMMGNKNCLGRRLSEDTRRKLSLSHTGPRSFWFGKSFSQEHRDKLRAAASGRSLSDETRRRIGASNCGKKRTVAQTLAMRARLKGRPLTADTRQKMSMSRRGSKHHNWKGGITPYNKKERNSEAYKAWRKAVFERDDYTCQMCGKRGGRLEAHHVKEFSLFTDLRFVVGNGQTLCKDPCHKATKSYGGRKRNRA